MSGDLLWPGDARAASLLTDAAVLAAMVRVESAWLTTSVPAPPAQAGPPDRPARSEPVSLLRPDTAPSLSAGLAPGTAPSLSAGLAPDTALSHSGDLVPGDASAGAANSASGDATALRTLEGLVGPADLPRLAEAAEDGGNPVIPLVALLRSRLPADLAEALHAGLTSQDVLDTGLVLALRDATARIQELIAEQVATLSALADAHRDTPMAGRTLTQHAVPITFGLKVAGWLTGVLDGRDALTRAADLPVQIGGAAGSLAAPTALAGSASAALDRVARTAAVLGLRVREPWHTARAPLTALADALVTCTDAWGRIAADVLVLGRPEIAEVTEGTAEGRGGSSTMPNKQNPVLAVLIRRAALAAPPLAATLHTAAATMIDERADGAWHVEWATIRTLTRRTVVAASQTADLLSGLRIDPARMSATLSAARPGIDAEQHKFHAPAPYTGATSEIIEAVRTRAARPPDNPC